MAIKQAQLDILELVAKLTKAEDPDTHSALLAEICTKQKEIDEEAGSVRYLMVVEVAKTVTAEQLHEWICKGVYENDMELMQLLCDNLFNVHVFDNDLDNL